jgi:hypothetical protein
MHDQWPDREGEAPAATFHRADRLLRTNTELMIRAFKAAQ